MAQIWPGFTENTRIDQIWDPNPGSGHSCTPPHEQLSGVPPPMGARLGPLLEPCCALMLVRCRVRPYPGPVPVNSVPDRVPEWGPPDDVPDVTRMSEMWPGCQKCHSDVRKVIKYRKVPFSVKPVQTLSLLVLVLIWLHWALGNLSVLLLMYSYGNMALFSKNSKIYKTVKTEPYEFIHRAKLTKYIYILLFSSIFPATKPRGNLDWPDHPGTTSSILLVLLTFLTYEPNTWTVLH